MKGSCIDKKTILLIDDDSDALECIQAVLSKQGYKPIAFSDSSAALSLAASDAALHLAIVDLILPETSGLEILYQLKRLRPELPCIMITTYCSVESYLKAKNLGVEEYLSKPVRTKDLRKIVAEMLDKPGALDPTWGISDN